MGFTPVLAEKCKKWNEKEKNIEVIFVSCDQEESDFKEYYGTMPWLALPFQDQRIEKLEQKFKVNSIPRLVIVGKDEKILQEKGVWDVLTEEEKAIESWKKLY